MKSQKPPQMLAGVGTRRDQCSGSRRAGGGGEERTACGSECESPTLPPGKAGQEKEGGTERPGGRANILGWARRGPLVNGGMKKVRDPRNSAAAKKSRVFRGLEGEGAAKDPLTYPFKNSHQNLLD